jgi:hypothetical protein
VDLLSEIVTNEFLALMEVSDRLPSLPMNFLATTHGPMPTAPGREAAAANESVESLLTEFSVLRSALVRRVEDGGSHSATFDANYAYVTDVCATRFNEQMDEIERWRRSEIVGFTIQTEYDCGCVGKTRAMQGMQS